MPSSKSPTARISPKLQLRACSTSRYMALVLHASLTISWPPSSILDVRIVENLVLIFCQGKAKHKAWQKEVDAKVSAADAEKRYIALVEKLKGSYGFDPNKAPEQVGA
jgi:pectin methylesterase-like acyl-CoA thioesterase